MTTAIMLKEEGWQEGKIESMQESEIKVLMIE